MSSATLDRPTATPPVTRPVVSRPAASRPTVRLTRRGRAAVLLLVALLAFATVLVGAKSVYAATVAGPPAATSTIVVQPGQTLWELAEQVAPNRDPRDVVKRISDANALSSAVVAPGQSLVIPAF